MVASDVRARRDERIDRLTVRLGNADIHGPQALLEVAHLAHTDDRRRHCGMAQRPGRGVARERHPDLVGHAGELLDDLERRSPCAVSIWNRGATKAPNSVGLRARESPGTGLPLR